MPNQYTGELEEYTAELETNRRKLAALRIQKESVAGTTTPSPHTTSKTEHGEKIGAEKVNKETKELEASLEEAKVHIRSACRLILSPLLLFCLSPAWR